MAQQRAGQADCLRVLPAAFVVGHQLPQGAPILLGQPLPLHQQPIAVATRQQLAAIEGRRLPQLLRPLGVVGGTIGPRQRLLIGDHVYPTTGVVLPLHGQIIGHQKAAGLRDGLPQAVPEMAAVGEGLLLGGIGPEKESDRPARNRLAAAQHQVGQQLLQARLIHPGDGLPPHRHLKAAQQPDGQGRLSRLRRIHASPANLSTASTRPNET